MIEFHLLTESGCFDLRAGYVTLGRDRRCTFVLPDASVQPLHASIEEHDGRLYVAKEHRDALTFVNRAPIHGRVQLFDGDLLDIGPWTLVIRSRALSRRPGAMSSAELSMELTPSDPAMVARYRLPDVGPAEDTSSSIIIL